MHPKHCNIEIPVRNELVIIDIAVEITQFSKISLILFLRNKYPISCHKSIG